jgi:hypothetical protein
MSELKTRAFGVEARRFIWWTLLLALAAGFAVVGSVARHDGERSAAAFLSVISLALLAWVSVKVIPRLTQRLRLDFLSRLQSFRFTKRGGLLIAIILLIAFACLNTGNNLLILVLSTLMASVLVSGMVSNLVLHDLQVSLKAPESIFAGQTATFSVTLQNLKRWVPSFALRLKSKGDQDGKVEGTDFFVQEKCFPYIAAKSRLSLPLECSFENRGVYSVAGFDLHTSFPFGFFARGRGIAAAGNIVVYPRLRNVAHLLVRYPQLKGSHERNARGVGGSLYNIRPYLTGDDARFVHWKSTAKMAKLMVKDLSTEEDRPVLIAFSTHLPCRNPQTLAAFETAVSSVASLCLHYYEGRRPYSFDSGEFQVSVDGADGGYQAVMSYLARVQPSDEEKLDWVNLPSASILFRAGSPQGKSNATVVDYLAGEGFA